MRRYSLDDKKIKKFCGDVRISLKMLDNLVSEGDYSAAVYSLMYRLRGLYVVHARVRKYTHKAREALEKARGANELYAKAILEKVS